MSGEEDDSGTYDRLAEHLARLSDGDEPGVRTSTLPDGSIDRFCRLSAGAYDPIAKRETFGREVREGVHTSFHRSPESVEPGGQSINAASQLHALGAETTAYGHLDDQVFATLPFETVSMGDPATVDVFDFEDGDTLLVEPSPQAPTWGPEDLRAAAAAHHDDADVDPFQAVFGTDAVLAANWITFPGLEALFDELAEADLPRIPFVFDPGDVVGSGLEDLTALLDALAGLQATFDVALSVNRPEVRSLAATLAEPPESLAGAVHDLREATGVTAVVLHAKPRAVAAVAAEGAGGSDEGGTAVHEVENLGVHDPERHTGGGDRFSGALAFARGAGWEWDTALALANTCASRYVKTGDTGGPAALRAFLSAYRPNASD